MISNNARVGRALYLLKLELDNFVPREFVGYHVDETLEVLNQILGQNRDAQVPFKNMKTQDLLKVVQASWWPVFDKALGGIDPGLVREVAMTHEAWVARGEFSGQSAFQSLSAIQRILAAMASPTARELETLKLECLESEEEFGSVAASESDNVVEGKRSPAGADSRGEPAVSDVGTGHDQEAPGEPTLEERPAPVPEFDEPYLEELVVALRNCNAVQAQDFMATATREAKPAQVVEGGALKVLSPELAQALAASGIGQLYDYQDGAATTALSGADVVLEADWAADETRAFAIPLAETLLRNPGSGALVLCPDAGSSNNIQTSLNRMLPVVQTLTISLADGKLELTPALAESSLPQVVVATVETLSAALPNPAEEWQQFLQGLRFVVLDQAQEYRGFLGASVAVLLRRLGHRLAVLGADPQYFVVARGCGNGAEFATQLTGRTMPVVSGWNTPEPKRHFVFVQPQGEMPGDHEVNDLPDLPDRVARAALACLAIGKSTVVYCASEDLAERCYQAADRLHQELAQGEGVLMEGIDSMTLFGVGPGKKVVFDVEPPSGLDAGAEFDGVILAGFPGSWRKQLELIKSVDRLGRDEAYALALAAPNSDDAFFVRNLETLLAKAPDQLVADAENVEAATLHLPSLLSEMDGRVYSFTREILGNTLFQLLRREVEQGARPSPARGLAVPPQEPELPLWRTNGEPTTADSGNGGWFSNESPPLQVISLVVREDQHCYSPATGVTLHLSTVTAEVEPIYPVDDPSSEGPISSIPAGSEGEQPLGDPDPENFNPTAGQVGVGRLTAQSFWLDIGGLLPEGDASEEVPGGATPGAAAVAALQHMLRLGVSLTFPVAANELATYSRGGSVYLVETTLQSMGVAKRAFDLWRDLLALGAELARNGPGAEGEINSPGPNGGFDGELDMQGGLALADRLLELTQGA